MEARGEEHHDVGLLLPLLPDVLVGHLPEGQRRGLLPHPESSADSLVGVVPTQLLRVVLDAGGRELSGGSPDQRSLPEGLCGCHGPGGAGNPGDAGYLKVRWLWLQRRPVSAYRFRRMLVFIRAPNWSGTPQRGRFIHLPGGHQARAQPTAATVPEGLQQLWMVRGAGLAAAPRSSSRGRQHPRSQVPAALRGQQGKPKSRGGSCLLLEQEEVEELTPWSPRPGRQ